ncbi:PcfJ domain-containing protein [uncultured Winogradskyella sp.]|uniref:PcfJ domain-containing protein n=1 Tax=uncultured Winogradskyella sp. TaxID=395353 RepID=UPI002621B87B|nr:PcfJ domain-containing protein [uncultured Winogradskyella sp.]
MKTNWNTQNKNIQSANYLKLVEKIYCENNKPTRYNGSIESMLREFFSKTSKKKYTWKRETFKRLLIHLYNQKCYALLRNYDSVNVIHNISAFGNGIVRPIENWKKETVNENDQLNSVIRHCFALYEAPKFLENSFYQSEKKYMLWYVQLGKGKSIKNLSNMPIKPTAKMAHEFRNAPSFLSVNEALRYAQAVGFGASTKTAKMLAFSRLSIIREDQEDFWASVIMFFSKEEDLNVNELDGIVDYLSYKYREDSSFSMKSRTLKALLNQTQEWHRNVYLKEKGDTFSWNSSGIKPLYFEEIVDNKKVVYKTEELLSSAELYDEGNEMQHCVSEYDDDCDEGRCSIFSLRQEVEGKLIKRLVTLEIELPSNVIVQAKAKCNQEPDSKSVELINYWINNSQVRRKKEMEYQRQNQPQVQQQAYARLVERRQMTKNQDYDSALVLKIIFWILYILFRIMMN